MAETTLGLPDRIRAIGVERRRALREADAYSASLATLAREHVGAGVSAAEFARLAGVPDSTVKRWVESG